MTAKQARKLKKGDKVIAKQYKYLYRDGAPKATAVDYVSYNPTCGQYFIATTDGWGGYHKRMDLVDSV